MVYQRRAAKVLDIALTTLACHHAIFETWHKIKATVGNKMSRAAL
jgi:hypothetical protein